MSVELDIACRDCKACIWAGCDGMSGHQFLSANHAEMRAIGEFLYDHRGHSLVYEMSEMHENYHRIGDVCTAVSARLKRTFHAEPQRSIVDAALRKIGGDGLLTQPAENAYFIQCTNCLLTCRVSCEDSAQLNPIALHCRCGTVTPWRTTDSAPHGTD